MKSIVRRHMAAIIQNHIGRSRARSRRFVKRDVLLTADAYPDPRTMPCFATYLAETKANTEFAGDKRIIQRGTTTEVLDQISAVSPDFVYIDGDLTLHGISIDLIKVYPEGARRRLDRRRRLRAHGLAAPGSLRTDPSVPLCVYFAEAMGARIFGLPHQQFLICKPTETGTGFEFVDLTESYPDTTLQGQFRLQRVL